MHQAGFVAQNVPNFHVFVSWCSDQASFDLAAEVQTCRQVHTNFSTVLSIQSNMTTTNKVFGFKDNLSPLFSFLLMATWCQRLAQHSSSALIHKAYSTVKTDTHNMPMCKWHGGNAHHNVVFEFRHKHTQFPPDTSSSWALSVKTGLSERASRQYTNPSSVLAWNTTTALC